MKILVVGDFIIDRYTYGTYTHTSSENANLKVFTAGKTEDRFGAAANIAYNCYFHSDETTLLASVKDDIETPFNFINIGGKSVQPFIERFVVDKDVTFRRDNLKKEYHDFEVDTSIYDVMILADHKWGIVDNAQKIIRASKCPVIVDPKCIDWTKYSGAFCIKSNNFEFELACGELNLTNIHLAIEKYQLSCMIITLGNEGVWYVDNIKQFKIPAISGEVIDTLGAGDTFISILACYFDKNDMYTNVAIANIASGLVCQKFGTYALRKNDLLSYDSNWLSTVLNEKYFNISKTLSATPDLIISMNESVKNEGNGVVFTFGCFDFIHHNHITLLKKARELGSKLIVGLYSDGSMTRIKRNPIIKEGERKLFLELLPFVDEVIIFEEDTPLPLIEKINPDIFAICADHDEYNFRDNLKIKNLNLKFVVIETLLNELSSFTIIEKIKSI